MIRTWAPWVWGTTIKALYKSTSFYLCIRYLKPTNYYYCNNPIQHTSSGSCFTTGRFSCLTSADQSPLSHSVVQKYKVNTDYEKLATEVDIWHLVTHVNVWQQTVAISSISDDIDHVHRNLSSIKQNFSEIYLQVTQLLLRQLTLLTGYQ